MDAASSPATAVEEPWPRAKEERPSVLDAREGFVRVERAVWGTGWVWGLLRVVEEGIAVEVMAMAMDVLGMDFGLSCHRNY